jgi:sigma-B regulation protein RsbU (phosphoserine phosphatase)
MSAEIKILVVDDDPLMRKMLARALGRLGFSVMECPDGEKALELLETLGGDALLVLDYEMPKLNGLEVCTQIRADANAEIAQTPIILLTAHTDELHEIECLRAGANDFVTKPVNLTVLKARLDTQLGLALLRRQLQAQNRQLEQWRSLHELDLEAAKLIQQGILSRKPELEGWEFEGHHQSLIQVGGDIYDWLKLPGGGLLIWMADATGHGASAALLTTFTKLLFRYAVNEASTPEEIIDYVNRDFQAIFKGHTFITVACAILEPGSGALRVMGAGHPPLIILRRNGDLEAIASTAPPIGLLMETQKARCVERFLASGDTLLMFTDGLYSALDRKGERITYQRFEEALQGCMPESAGAAIEGALARATQLAGAGETFDDDVALVAIRKE